MIVYTISSPFIYFVTLFQDFIFIRIYFYLISNRLFSFHLDKTIIQVLYSSSVRIKKTNLIKIGFYCFYLKLNFTVNMTWLGRSKYLVKDVLIVLISNVSNTFLFAIFIHFSSKSIFFLDQVN